MPAEWRDVHVFISSTFNDMHAERDYLVKRVFPELREWCERRKLRLVDIDLRWGVTEEDASRNRNAVRTCLQRIDECRPFFVCFLGQRRGWVPEPRHIDEDVFSDFPELKQYVGIASITELEILHALIQPLHGSERYAGARKEEFYRRVDHAFFYMRDAAYLSQLPDMLLSVYTNKNSEEPIRDDAELQRWRENVIPDATGRFGRPLRSYTAAWSPDAATPELALPLQCPSSAPENQARWRRQWREVGVRVADSELEVPNAELAKARDYNALLTSGRLTDFRCGASTTLADTMLDDLKKAIEERYPGRVPVEKEDPLQKELDQQEEFIYINGEGFIERAGDFDELDAYLNDNSGQMFVLTAPGGMGKSMLLANWFRRTRQDPANADTAFLGRFVGQSDGSSTVVGLLQLMMLELQQVHKRIPATRMETVKTPDGQEEQREVPIEIPQDPTEVHNTWRDLLEHLGDNGKTVILIDAINQLETGLENIYWLPFTGLPKDVKIVVSFREGAPGNNEYVERLAKTPSIRMSRVKPFEDLDDRRKLVQAYLRQFLKDLDIDHREALIQCDGAGNPLFLSVVLGELRVLGAFSQLGEVIRCKFGNTPESAFNAVLNRLESDPAYSAMAPTKAIPLIFGLLAHARRGLSIDELVNLLQANEISHALSKTALLETVNLFLRQVRSFLARRSGLYDFFYESFKMTAIARYTTETEAMDPMAHAVETWHGYLADYFSAQPDFEYCSMDDKKRHPHRRRCEELVWQLVRAGHWKRLKDLLMSIDFLEAKVVAGRTFELPIDFIDLLKQIPTDCSERKLIALLDEAIRRDIHFIARHADDYPQALFQCLWNSCWWYDSPEAERYYEYVERDECPRPGLSDLVNRWQVTKCRSESSFYWVRAVSPPHRHLRDGSGRNSTFSTSPDPVVSISCAPGGILAVGTQSGHIRVYSEATGQTYAEVKYCDQPVSTVICTEDGRRLASCQDRTVRVWSLPEMCLVHELPTHSCEPQLLVWDSNGLLLAVASKQGITVWNAQTWVAVRTIDASSYPPILSLTFLKGSVLLSGHEGGHVHGWDISSCYQNPFRNRLFGDAYSLLALEDGGLATLALGSEQSRVISFCLFTSRGCEETRLGTLSHLYRPTLACTKENLYRIAAVDQFCNLYVWNLHVYWNPISIEQDSPRVFSLGRTVRAMAWVSDGMGLAVGYDDGSVQLINLEELYEVRYCLYHKWPVASLDLCTRTHRVITASLSADFAMWSSVDGVCLGRAKTTSSQFVLVGFSLSGKWFYTIEDGALSVRDSTTLGIISSAPFCPEDRVVRAAFLGKNDEMVVALESGKLGRWNCLTWKSLGPLPRKSQGFIERIHCSASGRFIAVVCHSSRGFEVEVFRIHGSGHVLGPVLVSGGLPVENLAFSVDDRFIYGYYWFSSGRFEVCMDTGQVSIIAERATDPVCERAGKVEREDTFTFRVGREYGNETVIYHKDGSIRLFYPEYVHETKVDPKASVFICRQLRGLLFLRIEECTSDKGKKDSFGRKLSGKERACAGRLPGLARESARDSIPDASNTSADFEEIAHLISSGQFDEALVHLPQAPTMAQWIRNARAVCLFNIGRHQEGLDSLRPIVGLSLGGTMDMNTPRDYRINFVIGLLLASNFDAFKYHFNALADCSCERTKRLRSLVGHEQALTSVRQRIARVLGLNTSPKPSDGELLRLLSLGKKPTNPR